MTDKPDAIPELAGRLLHHMQVYKRQLQKDIKAEFTDDDGSFWTDAYNRYLMKKSTKKAKAYHLADETIQLLRQWATDGQPIAPDEDDVS